MFLRHLISRLVILAIAVSTALVVGDVYAQGVTQLFGQVCAEISSATGAN